MTSITSNQQLGKRPSTADYAVDFYNQNGEVIATVCQTDRKIGACVLKGPFSTPLAYNTLSSFNRSKIDQIMHKAESVSSKRQKLEQSATQAAFNSLSQDSDQEDLEYEKSSFVFQRNTKVPVTCMTIPCLDGNIKGSTLIEITHSIIQNRYGDVLDCACEYDKDRGGAAIDPPVVKNQILSINEPCEWFLSLGGWKGMMPSEEVQEYFFNQFKFPANRTARFAGVDIYQNGKVFDLVNHRIHLPINFSIAHFDVTGYWQKQGEKWVKIPSGKTDLSYSQIINALNFIKEHFHLEDHHIASLQLSLLSRQLPFPKAFTEQVNEKNQEETIQFLDYLNGLMFGVEASGLNTALATSLMTLDLIKDQKLDYKMAFNANADGGIYPYACYGNNRGTYAAREEILLHKKQYFSSFSMKTFRKDLNLSPVAVKEAVLIKRWLDSNIALSKESERSLQVATIKLAICDLVDFYFSPWLAKSYSVEKFNLCPEFD
ncbi:hypothetical protein PHSC3_000684 [Chlamydiales bacterium STE3]|nr:hypothetical protein PHSC3_000684 [Chlamydiales bacterium STE3]